MGRGTSAQLGIQAAQRQLCDRRHSWHVFTTKSHLWRISSDSFKSPTKRKIVSPGTMDSLSWKAELSNKDLARFLPRILLLRSEVLGREQKWKELLSEYTFGNKMDAFANV